MWWIRQVREVPERSRAFAVILAGLVERRRGSAGVWQVMASGIGTNYMFATFVRSGLRFQRENAGNVHVIMTLALVPIIGALGLAAEGANWWLTQRGAQNAADTAVMSASGNGGTSAAGSGSASSYRTTGCSTTPGAFDCEAVGAAARAGFVNGSGNAVVYPQYLTNATTPACPNALTACYKVSVIRTLPVYLLGLALNGQSTQNVQAVAYAAMINNKTAPDCLFALASKGGSQAFPDVRTARRRRVWPVATSMSDRPARAPPPGPTKATATT